MTAEQIRTLILLILLLHVVAGIVAFSVLINSLNAKYRKFVIEHSESLKQLDEINAAYRFNAVKLFDLRHSYDNENFFDTISTRDYLIYQLAHAQKEVIKSIKAAQANKELHEKYKEEIAEKCILGTFDTDELLSNEKKLLRTEARMFKQKTKQPITAFSIYVCLELTKINGVHRDSKCQTYYSPDVMKLIQRINNKSGDFYNDTGIWDAICRVERGKVSNRLRFAIYERDGNRCRKCGRRTGDLEIDHIVPIAKGGKTTYDNLQTLCHRCNMQKGTRTEFYSNKSRRF